MNKKNISLALSGSGYLFEAHAGAIHALIDLGYQIVEIAGTSGGAIIASLYATGMSVEDMKDLCLDQDWSMMMERRWFWDWPSGICDGIPILEWMTTQTDSKVFSETDIPLIVMTSNVNTGQGQMFSTKSTPDVNIALAARMSSSIPFIYPLVEYENSRFCDGGVRNNIATDRLTSKNKIGIEIQSSMGLIDGNPSLWELGKRLIGMMMSANENARVAWARQTGATIISVDCAPFSALDNTMSKTDRETLYQRGYQAVMDELRDK